MLISIKIIKNIYYNRVMKQEKKAIRNLFLLLLLTFFANILFAQTIFSQADLIKKEIPKEKHYQLDEAEVIISDIEYASSLIEQNDKAIYHFKEKISSYGNNKEAKVLDKKVIELQKNSGKELVKIANYYSKHYQLIYTIYRDQLVTYQTTDRQKRLKVNKLLESAKTIKTKIHLIVESLPSEKEYNELKKQVTEISLLHTEGTDNLNECFCTFLNCYQAESPIYASTSSAEETQRMVKKESKNVVFKIQILAAAERREIEALQKKYALKHSIEETYITEDKLYRYTVGEFSDYYIAKNYSENIGVKDAFVVSFLNGKRITIEEAIALIENY